MNLSAFQTQLLHTALGNAMHQHPALPQATVSEALSQALDEAHSALGQHAFFAVMDASGGKAKLMQLLTPKMQEMLQLFRIGNSEETKREDTEC